MTTGCFNIFNGTAKVLCICRVSGTVQENKDASKVVL